MDQDETYGRVEPGWGDREHPCPEWGDCIALGVRPVCPYCKEKSMRCLVAALVTGKAIEKWTTNR